MAETPREIAHRYSNCVKLHGKHWYMCEKLADAITAAITAEREANAKVCEALSHSYIKDGERWLKGNPQRGTPDKRLIDIAPNIERQHLAEMKARDEPDVNRYEKCAAAIRARGGEGE